MSAVKRILFAYVLQRKYKTVELLHSLMDHGENVIKKQVRSMCVGVKEQNIHFLFILFLICSLMCKSERQLQLGKSWFTMRQNTQLLGADCTVLSTRVLSAYLRKHQPLIFTLYT